MKRRFLFSFIGSLFGILWMATVSALMVMQLNIHQLTALSEKVFVGRCLSVTPDTDPEGRLIQTVTFQVNEMIKGDPSDKVSFTQLASVQSNQKNLPTGTALIDFDHEMPEYKVGEDAIVFLSADGRRGLTAPVGLRQGKFDVRANAQGQKIVENGVGNKGLFLGWKKIPHLKSLSLSKKEELLLETPNQEMPYDDFMTLIRKIAAP